MLRNIKDVVGLTLMHCLWLCLFATQNLVPAHSQPADMELAEGEFMPGLTITETEQLDDGLYAFRWEAYRSLFMVTEDGVIVTDPISVKAASRYLEEIRKITDKPIRYLLYSHAHWDHASGGQVFKQEGATIIAQERCVDNMRTSPNPDVIPPDATFKDRIKIDLGGKSVEMHYYGPSHGTCLSVMLFKPNNILYTVDIVSPPSGRYMPWDPQVADFHFYNAVNYLRQLEALVKKEDITQMVGGHLVPVPAGNGKLRGLPALGPTTAITERPDFLAKLD